MYHTKHLQNEYTRFWRNIGLDKLTYLWKKNPFFGFMYVFIFLHLNTPKWKQVELFADDILVSRGIDLNNNCHNIIF